MKSFEAWFILNWIIMNMKTIETMVFFLFSYFRNSSFFETRSPFFFFSFKLILWCNFYTSSFKFFLQVFCGHNLWPQVYRHKAITITIIIISRHKKGVAPLYSPLHLLFVCFTDSVAVLDPVSDCPFLRQNWYPR